MAPLIILLAVTAVVRLMDVRRHGRGAPWAHALRYGLAAMFVATGGAHFIGMREDLIAMVPPDLPNPGLLITITGILELAGAVGLVWRRTTELAAACLGLMMIAMFPANVYAATHDLVAEWTDNLVPRTILQIVFLAATAIVALHYFREDRAAPATDESRVNADAA